jgi:hypothetical protein
MKTWVRKTISVGVLAAGALLFAPTAAQAEIDQISFGNDGVLNGTQVAVPIQVPVNVCGNGVGVIGVGVGVSGLCANGAAHDIGDDDDRRKGKKESARTEDATQISGDNDGVLNGTQVYVPIQVPINVCGNGVGVIGVGVGISGACFNGAAHDIDEESSRESRTEDLDQVSWDNDGVLNGTQIAVPIQVPINVCGNGVGVIGVGVGISGACVNGAAHDIDDDDDNGNGNGHHHYKGKGKKDGYKGKDRSATTESLPLVGDLPALGSSTGSSVGTTTQNLPVAGALGSGVRTSKVNVGGVDPMALLSQVPTA